MLKRAISLFLIATFTVCSLLILTSCGSKISDETAKNELEKLLPKAKILTEIFLADGLKTEDVTEETKNYYYLKVREDSPYKTIEELKAAAEEVFSIDFLSKNIYVTAFEGITEESIRPKFAENTEGVLTIFKNAEKYPVRQEIYLDTAKVVSGNKYTAKVSVKAKSSRGEEITITIDMVKENGKWLLNSFAY